MIIAGDVGGTKARIGLFARRAEKVELIVSERYASGEFSNLESIIERFLKQHQGSVTGRLEAACFGLPGPVIDGRVKVTNLPWEVAQSEVASALRVSKVKLVNDLVSTAAAIPNFSPESLATIYDGKGEVNRSGSCVVVAPGTGLGHSLIHREPGWSVLLASEGGHANFAPTDDIEIELLEYLQKKLPHVSVESVLCGPGLVNIYSFLCDSGRGIPPAEMAQAQTAVDKAAIITTMALAGKSDVCVSALEMFCSMLGAHCSNIVLTYLATSGVFLGGGIPPKIIDFLSKGSFVSGYLKKGKQLEQVEATPVFVVKDDHAALYGAAAIAATL
jgi:glucokinase